MADANSEVVMATSSNLDAPGAAGPADDWTALKECDSFMCPMTLSVMEDPVSTADGQCYERAEIERWLEINDTSPATGLPLASKALVPNLGLKKAIEEFSQDPAGQKVLEELSLREDGQEPAFPGGDAGGEGGADGEEEATNVELLIVGPSGVGKSSLLRRIRDGEFSDVMDSTIGLDYETKKVVVGNKPCSVKIWDTSGQPLFRHTIQTQYRRADVIMFVYDVTRPETLEQLESYLQDAKELVSTGAGLAKPHELVLVGNKIDAHDSPRLVTPEAASAVVERHGLFDYREVSARTGANVKLAFHRAFAHGAYRLAAKERLRSNNATVRLAGRRGGSRSAPQRGGCACGV